MHPHRSLRTLGLWLALAATLMSALAPSVARAMVQRTGHLLVEVCTSTGSSSHVVSLDVANPESDPAPDHAPCPYCLLQAHDLPVPAPSATLSWQTGLAHALPEAFLQAPATLHAWRAAQPRGPPQAG